MSGKTIRTSTAANAATYAASFNKAAVSNDVTKNFKDYVDFGTGLGRILKPYVERIFTYYEE